MFGFFFVYWPSREFLLRMYMSPDPCKPLATIGQWGFISMIVGKSQTNFMRIGTCLLLKFRFYFQTEAISGLEPMQNVAQGTGRKVLTSSWTWWMTEHVSSKICRLPMSHSFRASPKAYAFKNKTLTYSLKREIKKESSVIYQNVVRP